MLWNNMIFDGLIYNFVLLTLGGSPAVALAYIINGFIIVIRSIRFVFMNICCSITDITGSPLIIQIVGDYIGFD